MKDHYRRRRKAERHLTGSLPDVDSSRVFAPIHQEYLDIDCAYAVNVCAQGNELIVVSTGEWWLEVYSLNDDDSSAPLNRDSISEMSAFSDDGLIPNKRRTSLWHKIPRTSACIGSVKFIAPGVIGCVEPETPGVVSTWCMKARLCLERVTLRGVQFNMAMCKISDTEFVIGSEEGHLCFFTHKGGCNLEETSRIWKAHTRKILFVSFHEDIMVTTSADCSTRLWDVKTKKKLAVLYHDEVVHSAAISDKYIVTCSWFGHLYGEKGELRIYRNGERYPLIKILRHRETVVSPIFVDGGRILCRTIGPVNDDEPIVRNSLMVFDIESESILAQLKVGCRSIDKVAILADGRLVAVGAYGCRGVIATFSDDVRKLIAPKTTEKQSKVERRRMCSLM